MEDVARDVDYLNHGSVLLLEPLEIGNLQLHILSFLFVYHLKDVNANFGLFHF